MLQKKDVRIYLNGINFEVKDGKVIIVGTNGHVLFAIRINIDLDSGDHNFTIGNEILDHIDGKCDVEIVNLNGNVTLEQNGRIVSGKAIEANYHDWRKAIPTEISGEISQFAPEYLVSALKAKRILLSSRRAKDIYVHHNGRSPCIVDIGIADCLILISPMNADNLSYVKPEWGIS